MKCEFALFMEYITSEVSKQKKEQNLSSNQISARNMVNML